MSGSVFLSCLVYTRVQGTGSSCDDIDPQACTSMSKQNANLCLEPILANTACPKLCGKCPTTCYSCNTTTPDVTSCNTETCDNNKLCMVRLVTSTRSGQKKYYFGCATETTCDGGKKRTLNSRSVSLECCASDLCNTPTLTSTTQPTTVTATRTRATPTPISSTIQHTTVQPTTTKSTTIPSTKQTTKRYTQPAYTVHYHIPPPLPVCARDIIVFVDRSIGFGRNFHYVRNFLLSLVRSMSIGSGVHSTQLALSLFDSRIQNHWNLDTFGDKTSLSNAISRQPFYATTSINDISQPMQFLLTYYNGITQAAGRYGDRPHVPDVAVILTGSFGSSRPLNTIKYQSSLLHHLLSSVITIGVGNANHQLLDTIATDNHSVYIKSTADLNDNGFKRKFLNLVCN